MIGPFGFVSWHARPFGTFSTSLTLSKMDGRRIDAILEMAKAAIANGTYLAISSQGIVAAKV